MAGHRWVVQVPAGLVRSASRLPGFQRVMGVGRPAIEYVSATAEFSTAKFTRFCEEARIPSCRLKEAYDALVDYYAARTGRVRAVWPRF